MTKRGWTNILRDQRTDLSSFSPMELVDLVLDREFDSQDEMCARAIIESDANAADALRQSQGMLDALRTPVPSPDFVPTILDEVGARREWLPPILQRIVPAGRFAVAAVLLAAMSVGLLARRAAPDAAIFQSGPTPVTDVVRASAFDAAAGMQNVSNVFDFVRTESQPAETFMTSTLVIRVQSQKPCPTEARAAKAIREAGCASEALAVGSPNRVHHYGELLESKDSRTSDESRWTGPPRQ